MLTGSWNPHDEDDEMPACEGVYELVTDAKYPFWQRVQVPVS